MDKNQQNNLINIGSVMANIENMKADISEIKTRMEIIFEKVTTREEVATIRAEHAKMSDRVDGLQKFMYIATGVIIAAEFIFKILFK